MEDDDSYASYLTSAGSYLESWVTAPFSGFAEGVAVVGESADTMAAYGEDAAARAEGIPQGIADSANGAFATYQKGFSDTLAQVMTQIQTMEILGVIVSVVVIGGVAYVLTSKEGGKSIRSGIGLARIRVG